MKKRLACMLFLLIALFIVGCTNVAEKQESEQSEQSEIINEDSSKKTKLMISAAVSLADALEEIKKIYEEDHEVELMFNLGGSGSLAQQIKHGAPVDVFISANQKWMDILEEEGLIIPETRSEIANNQVVLVAKKSSERRFESLEEISPEHVKQIAIGNPDSVPAGQYTKEALENLGKWEELQETFVLGKDVRQVLTYVETGNVDVGFVYASDALASDKINVLAKLDSNLHGPLIYPAAVITGTKNEEKAKEFTLFMTSEKAQAILDNYGFINE